MVTTPKRAGNLPFSPPVLWTGVAAGTFVAAWSLINGVTLPIPGVGPLITVALIVAAAVVLAELIRRHHRTVARHAARHGRRGGAAAGRWTRQTARAGLDRAAAWADAHRTRRQAAPGGSARAGWPGWLAGLFPEVAAAAVPAQTTPAADLPAAGAGTPPPEKTDGGTTSMTSKIAPERRARRTATKSGGAVPSEWGPVITQTADFEPEDDGELLEWMTRQLTGLSGWAEALVDFYEHCTQVIGIDPKASAMLHDVADAAAQAAETMGAAKARFTEHYELPREFAANGGLMTHDGRWVTGEGA